MAMRGRRRRYSRHTSHTGDENGSLDRRPEHSHTHDLPRKVGANGNPTRFAFIADKMNWLLVQVETQLGQQRRRSKEAEELTAELEQKQKFVAGRKKLESELRGSIREAQQDLLKQNPKGDTLQLDRDAAIAISGCEDEPERAIDQVEELKKSVTMKRTALRRTDDRIEHYRKQVYEMLAEASKGNQAAA